MSLTLLDRMSGRLDAGMASVMDEDGATFSNLPVDALRALPQVRQTFDGEDSTIAELAESIRVQGVLQPLLVRPDPDGDGQYLIVAGERRWRAAREAGLATVPAVIRDMTDEEAAAAQVAENIHRLNLLLIEEAEAIKAVHERTGSVSKTAKHFGKSAGWVSQRLALLDLPEQAQRLIGENLSADVDLINSVRKLEEKDAAAAARTVEKIKASDGSQSARQIVKEAREQVQPQPARKPKDGGDKPPKAKKTEGPKDLDLFSLLEWCWGELGAVRFDAQAAIEAMGKDVRKVERVLRKDFEAGCGEQDPVHAMLYRVRTEIYDTAPGGGRLRVAAFMKGALSTDPSTFELADILNSARVGR